MLLDARRDRGARTRAVATFPVWWSAMPETTRHNIDFKVDAWLKDHPRATPQQANTRKTQMLLHELRNNRRNGLRKLSIPERLPR